MEGAYLLQEGTGAGMDGRDISRFLIGGVLGHEGRVPVDVVPMVS
jgi:hypothetical protein